MKRDVQIFVLLLLVMVLSGCAGVTPTSYEQPVVSLQTFRILPQTGGAPRFEIGLQVINPNRESLSFEGIFYTVEIEGYRVLAGVSNDLPTVAPYSEAAITLEAGIDLIEGIRLINRLMMNPRETFHYAFKAKLDPGGFSRSIVVEEEGEINMSPQTQ